ncbi:MAG TPA: M48 family metallopeptidase [Allosphingosinicella sp.]|nr:M48 family metallopeptidase [Allosphingosinicella sp.]
MARGWLYDGESAVRRDVEADGHGAESLRIELADGGRLDVPWELLCHVESRKGCEVYGRTDVKGWRLGLFSEGAEGLLPRMPRRQRYGGLIDRMGLGPAVVAGLLFSGLIVFIGFTAPTWLAPLVPMSWEKKFGDSLVGEWGGRFCKGPGGQQALEKLAGELSPRARDLDIRVVHAPLVNAAALPGGHIVIFDELLKQADSADELAGVLAHEIAHVERRHTTQAMIRELGVGVFVSAIGGRTGSNAETLLSARYSRGAESQADGDAIETLRRANISPLATAGFFDRLGRDEAKLGQAASALSYLSTHPLSAERRQRFRASAEKGRAYQPALNRDEWEALFNICFNDPRRGSDDLDFF